MNQDVKILVVDDDDIIISVITTILRQNNYATDYCYSGEEALEKIQVEKYALILMDVKMGSGLDGYETCKLIHQTQPDMPVILVTANQDDDSVNRGFESGSSDYIKKPVSRLELLARVNNIITLKRSENSNLQLIDALRKDLNTAAIIQQAMLPKWVYLDGNLLFSSFYEACEAVGGDVFDWIKLDENKYVVYIGDVSGHGVQAALLMTAIKSNIKMMIEAQSDFDTLADFFNKLNERLCNELFLRNNYLTLLMGVIDLELKEFRYLNAGHPPLIIFDTLTNGIKEFDEKGSLPLGWLKNTKYLESDIGHIPLNPNDIFLIFTDGIYECTNPENEQLGIKGLSEFIQEKISIDSCISIPSKIKHYLSTSNYKTSLDDFTLVSFQVHHNRAIKSVDELSQSTHSNKAESINPETPAPVRAKYRIWHHHFFLHSALKEVGRTAQECEKLVIDWTGDLMLAAKVELIVDEFLNNIIQYGYRYVSDAEIVLEFKILNDKLTIRFWDVGIEWVPENQTYSIDNPYDFDQDVLGTSGRGVLLIMSMSNLFVRTRYDNLNETKVEIDL